jgi:hypothetical protein
MYQNEGKYTKLPLNYQMTIKCTKQLKNIPTLSIPRPSKIYPNWYFWFENMPSGNPAPLRNEQQVAFFCFKREISLNGSVTRRLVKKAPNFVQASPKM